MNDDVSTQLGKIDRDKAKHHQIKTSPVYNGRQKALRVEKKTRTAEDPELITRAAAQKQKTREKQRHWYSARKQLLYEAKGKEGRGTDDSAEADGTASAGPMAKKKRGRPKKKVKAAEDGDKENVDPSAGSAKSGKRQKTVVGLVEDRDTTERTLRLDCSMTVV